MKYLVLALALALVAVAANADWDHPVKWDQLMPPDSYGGASWIDNDTPSDALTADDFLCLDGAPISEVYFRGWSYYGIGYLAAFRVTFWTDVPATPNDESHPGELIYDEVFGPADPAGLGWKQVDPENDANLFVINIPECLWFPQERGNIYWIGIQGVMVDDGYFDAFYWQFRERHEPVNLDDAAFASDYFGYLPWANWGFQPDYGDPALFDGPLPDGWTSADMCFSLHGIPEPGMLSLLGLAGLSALAIYRRK
jgi:hypothetical protein